MLNDIHGKADVLTRLCKRVDFSGLGFVAFNGDMSSSVENEEQLFTDYIDASVALFASGTPILFNRGNHETRGVWSDRLIDYFPTRSGEFYGIYRYGDVCLLVLDCGEDKPDSDIRYYGLGDWDAYRQREAAWLKEVVRSEEFRTAEGQAKAAGVCKLLGLDGIVAIGGDGTFRGAQELSKCGVSVVGIPGTIDNDIVCTDYSIGFDTAANTAVECIDKLRDTMQSHERCAVVEVMGRHAGYLALYVGVAVGATAVLVPEHPYDFKVQVADNIRHARLNGKTNFMIVVAEGAASAVEVGRQIQEELALDPRVTILGHIQRGGSPTAKDRVMATRMGYEAVRVLAEGKTNRVICAKDDQIIDLDIDEGLAMKKTLNSEEFKVMTVMTGM